MEKLLSYIWQYNLLKNTPVAVADGAALEIISVGVPKQGTENVFCNADLKIGDKRVRGSVILSDDNSVCLPDVVLRVTTMLNLPTDNTPVLRLNISLYVADAVKNLFSKLEEMPCRESFEELSSLALADIFTSLAIERLQSKSLRVLRWLDEYCGDWEEVCYVLLARSLGFGINGNAFESLARNLPLRFLMKHSDSLFQIEAMLFGVAGLLSDNNNAADTYYGRMVREFDFLRRKFSLTVIDASMWRFYGTRPSNFPHQRIAYLAKLVYGGFSMFSKIIDSAHDENSLRGIFGAFLSDYWDTHYTFGTETPPLRKTMGKSATDILIINCVSPLLYSYGCVKNATFYTDKAISIMESCGCERNAIVRRFTSNGVKCENALSSQALIELYNNYCSPRRCFLCRVGHRYLSNVVGAGVSSF